MTPSGGKFEFVWWPHQTSSSSLPLGAGSGELGAGSWERRKVASLLRHGVSVEARDERGRAALMAAAQVGRTNAVDALAGTHNANELGSYASSASSNHLQ
ncbi:MAG: hypothetical protein ABGY24_05700 [bacterium]